MGFKFGPVNYYIKLLLRNNLRPNKILKIRPFLRLVAYDDNQEVDLFDLIFIPLNVISN